MVKKFMKLESFEMAIVTIKQCGENEAQRSLHPNEHLVLCFTHLMDMTQFVEHQVTAPLLTVSIPDLVGTTLKMTQQHESRH